MIEQEAPEERLTNEHPQFAWMLEQLIDVFLNAPAHGEAQARMIDGIFVSAASKLAPRDLFELKMRLGPRIAELPGLAAMAASAGGETARIEKRAESAVVVSLPQRVQAQAAERGAAPDFGADQSCPFGGLSGLSAKINFARAADAGTLLRIASSPDLPEALTNVLISRGSRAVHHAAAGNPSARFAKSCFMTLAELAPSDKALREALAMRSDLPEPILGKIMPFLPDAVKSKALAAASALTPEDAEALLSGFVPREDKPQAGADEALRDSAGLAAAAFVLARRLAIPPEAALTLAASRYDHAVCVAVKAAGGSEKGLAAMLDLRRRTGVKTAGDSRQALRVFASLSAEDALRQAKTVAALLCAAHPASENPPRLAVVA